ncbi:MAG: polysaccharide deacetylase family protein, partial [Candidatus Omnitrophica bacterium]|nr:polysaccharide deacetylase family protein [Candidatus Omnitrophota bacterium]
MYHAIGSPDLVSDLNNVDPAVFERQMAFLKEHHYRVIPVSEYADGIRAGKRFSHDTVVITFDDGYLDNYEKAYPVLKKYGFPAVIFVGVDNVGTKGRMTWDQLR